MILPSHFGVPVASHGGNGEPLHTGCRSPSIDSKHRSAAAPKEYVCRDKNSPCCRQSPSDSRPLAVPCRHVLSHFVPGAYFSSNPVTYGASEQSPAPPVYATFAHCVSNGGVMFARNFKYPRTTEPELDANSLASLGIESTLLSSSEMPRRFPLSLSRPQTVKDTCQH